jgi:hypothetical protein
MGEHINRLVAARFQWDMMGCENLVIARTDSESGRLISSAIDVRDHEFILGVAEDVEPLAETLQAMEREGASPSEIDAYELDWVKKHKLVTIDEGIHSLIPYFLSFSFYFFFPFVSQTPDHPTNFSQLSMPISHQRAHLNPLEMDTEPMSRPILIFPSLAAAPWRMITPEPLLSGLATAHVPVKDTTTTAPDFQLQPSERKNSHHTQISSGWRLVTQTLRRRASWLDKFGRRTLAKSSCTT